MLIGTGEDKGFPFPPPSASLPVLQRVPRRTQCKQPGSSKPKKTSACFLQRHRDEVPAGDHSNVQSRQQTFLLNEGLPIKNPPKGVRTWQPHSAGPEHATNPTCFGVRLDSIKKIIPRRRIHLDGVMGCLLAHSKTQILRQNLFLKHKANSCSSGICEWQVPRG